MASPRLIRMLVLCGSLGLLASPALARSEYGYKDRIFEQKYVLPEMLTRLEVLNQGTALWAFADPNRFFSTELADAMGGMCDLALVAIKTVNQEPLTQAQIFFSNLDAQQDRSLSEPAPPDEMCRLQTGYFKAAYADDMSTDRQLADLAAQIRKRFAADWLSRAEAGRADIQLGAQRYARIQRRIDLLTRVGISVPKANLGGINLTHVKESLTLLANDDAYAATERSLSQLESDIIWRVQQRWLREGRNLKSPPSQPGPSGDTKPATFEDAYKVFRQYLGQCWDVPFRFRQSHISVTVRVAFNPDGSLKGDPSVIKQERDTAALTESILYALKGCAPYVFFPSDQYETWRELQLTFTPQNDSRSDAASDTAAPERESAGQEGEARQAQTQAQATVTAAADALDAAQARVARARQAVQAAERRLQERSAAIQADQARRMQNLAMGMARGPYGMAQAFQDLAGGGGPDPLEGLRRERARAQRELDQAMTALAALRSAPKTASAPQAVSAAQPGEERCVEGGRCTIVERTVFCRTPQQLTAILSERPGPARRRVRDLFASTGDCTILDVGEALHWLDAIVVIQPKGEAPAELVPVARADGRTGFVLSGGVGMAAPATAQR